MQLAQHMLVQHSLGGGVQKPDLDTNNEKTGDNQGEIKVEGKTLSTTEPGAWGNASVVSSEEKGKVCLSM